ncbi:MAG TPA: DHHA1 domain-containing protein [Blastocatellia bacterium]|nr:DHHA1 domain-containing protein [Blastocatellia bacterium]
MQPTEKLYFTDSGLLEFSATVLEVTGGPEGARVVLDRTAFYPTGGGQPHDTGRIDGAEVIDVIEDDSGSIIHVVKEGGGIDVGSVVRGALDHGRRLDHLQQHSGQHILSQAFVQACGAETRSFHLGAETSTIDIELQAPSDEHMRAAEDVANAIIFEDRPMQVHLVSEEEASRLPLRKESAVRGTIRVIEVEGFDWSPCGGTHAKRTGQIGLIAIKSFERVKKMARVEFVCGARALKDYRLANNTALAVARLFSTERDATPELVKRALDENKSIRKRLRGLAELAVIPEAASMLSAATVTGDFKVVEAIFEERDADELRLLAAKLTQLEPSIALLGSRDGASARLVFARSAMLSQNMGELLSESCRLLGGRGGGRPDMAQGGGPAIEKLDEAIAVAAEKVRSCAAR